ncbi:MAG: MFS transporter [Ruminococcaceae bacterium]|nr:MFS transporter [Oscillospiraceae bacterium]
MTLQKKFLLGTVYGFIHFSVEVTSFYFLFSRITASPVCWVLALFFDAIAFLSQGILGNLIDRYLKCNIGLIGCLLMMAALWIGADVPALVLLALGNAMIHIAGAQHTLRGTKGKIAPNAVFVGGGSFGVITGQLLGGAASAKLLVIPLFLMAVSTVAVCVIHKRDPLSDTAATLAISADRGASFLVLCTLVAVIVRGYTAYAIPTEWNKAPPQAVALFVCMGIGKILGGVLGDRIGFRRVSMISLLGGLPFLLAGNTNITVSLLGVALFSMTMPVTVAILVSAFPKRVGFAFGITTIGLFLGSAPAFFVRPQTLFAHQITVIALTLAALPAVFACTKKGR